LKSDTGIDATIAVKVGRKGDGRDGLVDIGGMAELSYRASPQPDSLKTLILSLWLSPFRLLRLLQGVLQNAMAIANINRMEIMCPASVADFGGDYTAVEMKRNISPKKGKTKTHPPSSFKNLKDEKPCWQRGFFWFDLTRTAAFVDTVLCFFSS
jgi:hypothetical protein